MRANKNQCCDYHCSLSSTKWSSYFEVVLNLSILRFCCEGHIGLLSVLSHGLDVDVLEVINTQRFSLLLVQQLRSIAHDLSDSVAELFLSLPGALVMDSSEEPVVLLVT